MVFHGTRLVFHRAERRRREARHETYITPKLVTTRRSILGLPAEGRPGPSEDYDDNNESHDQRASEQPAAGEGRARHRGLDVHRQQGRR